MPTSTEAISMEEVPKSTSCQSSKTDVTSIQNTKVLIKDEEATIGEDTPETNKKTGSTGLEIACITIALCLSVFCMALDNTIISTAIPQITDDFHSLGDVGWYGSAYLLTQSAFQLPAGKLYSEASVKRIYLVFMAIFEIGSVVCGAAPNSVALIVGRAIAGLGASGIFSGAMLILSKAVPLEKRPAYMGLIGGVYGLSSVAGPLMGGAFTDKVTWRLCFYINLPFGLISVVFIAIFYREDASPLYPTWPALNDIRGLLERLDVLGTVILVPTIICLLLAVQWGGHQYAWSDGRIIALFVLFGLLLCAFLAIQLWKGSKAMVPPRVIAQRSMVAGVWFVFCLGAAFVLFTYYLPIWFQAVKDTSAVRSGINVLPMILSLVICTMISGLLVTRFGYYTHFFILSSICLALGSGLLTQLEPGTSASTWIGFEILLGAGVGFGVQQMLVAAQVVLAANDVATGTALVMFAQTLGGTLFLAVAQSVFQRKLLQGLEQKAPQVDAAALVASGATAYQGTVPTEYLSSVHDAYNEALTETFVAGVVIAAMSILGALGMEWKNVHTAKKSQVAA
ncbi:hypothetical protein PRZ48_008231 [Zasmidium cellare]|uniref:Major facilitator superfamily (MFS) profile domain-containing protein n=1 Tax=Zasmidium cellare TaxID=395010 RepID=A0ABR0EEX8_ZASCE|nr:hypothetical protein PRZ48_008231 [Zasmidium cellare]